MRCFIAIELEKSLRPSVENLQKLLGVHFHGLSFVRPENLHFTLKFLGELNEDEINNVKKSIGQCISGMNSFKINISGLGFFGRKDSIRVLWLGITDGRERFAEIMESINSQVNFGERETMPHLTIARVKKRQDDGLVKFIEKNENVKIGEMRVDKIKLKSSILAINGPIYSDLFSFKLGEVDQNE